MVLEFFFVFPGQRQGKVRLERVVHSQGSTSGAPDLISGQRCSWRLPTTLRPRSAASACCCPTPASPYRLDDCMDSSLLGTKRDQWFESLAGEKWGIPERYPRCGEEQIPRPGSTAQRLPSRRPARHPLPEGVEGGIGSAYPIDEPVVLCHAVIICVSWCLFEGRNTTLEFLSYPSGSGRYLASRHSRPQTEGERRWQGRGGPKRPLSPRGSGLPARAPG